MPLNLIKEYSDLLDLDFLTEAQRRESLYGVFKRDIEDNDNLRFKTKKIYPVKIDKTAMQTLFSHLINKSEEVEEDGIVIKKRNIYDAGRSKRLHWIRHHLEEKQNENMAIFSIEERVRCRNVIRTYIYDISQKYVIVLEPQRTNQDYYLLSAHYLDEVWAIRAMDRRINNKLPDLY